MTSDAESGDLIAILKISGHGDHHMRGQVTIGRDPRAEAGATVTVDGDPLVSKSHLSVDLDQGDLIITDLGSSNGTYVHHTGGEIAVPSDRWIPIPAGAEIEFGDQRMTLESVAPTEDPAPDVDSDPTPDNAPTVEHASPAAQPVAGISGSFWASESDEAGAGQAAADPTPPATSTPVAAAPATAAAAPRADDRIACAQCERQLPPSSKFCDGCGTPVMPDPVPASDAAPAPAPGSSAPAPVDDPGHTVVVPAGGFAAATPTPAAHGAISPAPPELSAQPVQPAPQYGGAPPQGPPSAQYGQPAPVGSQGTQPEQTGGLVFVDPTASSSPGGAGKKVLLGIGALVVLGLIGFGLVTLLGGSDEPVASGRRALATVPTEIEQLWSTDVVGEFGFPGVGERGVYVAAQDDTDVVFTSLARDDGDENWEATVDDSDFGSFIGEFGDVTVVSVCAFEAGNACAIIGLDIDDGDQLWRERLDDGFAVSINGRLIGNDGDGLLLLDPATGDRLERVRGEASLSDFNALLLDDDGEVSVYDVDLVPLLGPVEVDEDATAVAFDGERLVVAIDDEIEYIDTSGDVTPGPILDGEITRIVAVDPSTLVAELGDEVVIYDLDGNDADERWAEDGTIRGVTTPEGGAVVTIDTGSDQLVIDLDSGDDRFEVDGTFEDGITTSPASNALVVIDRGDIDNFAGEATVTAYDWATGDEIWSEDVEGTVRVDDVIVVVEMDGDVNLFG